MFSYFNVINLLLFNFQVATIVAVIFRKSLKGKINLDLGL